MKKKKGKKNLTLIGVFGNFTVLHGHDFFCFCFCCAMAYDYEKVERPIKECGYIYLLVGTLWLLNQINSHRRIDAEKYSILISKG